MKLDLRIAVPAALAVAAAAIPATASADNSGNVSCPDPNSGYLLVPTVIAPSGADKDRNGDGLVCMKLQPQSEPTKDNNNPVSTNPDDYVDDIIL